MAISTTKAGPYYASGAISFSSLRSNFRAQNIDGTFNTDTLSIKASELIRVTSQTVTNPTVPDATENSSIPISVGAGVSIKASNFRNSIKYFYLTQSGTNDNTGNSSVPGLSLSSAYWNSNLNKNIRKRVNISGTIGSSYNNQPAFSFSDSMCNLIISVTGGIYGAGGIPGRYIFNRYFSSSSGNHFYSTSPTNEFLTQNGYVLEQANYFQVFKSNAPGTTALYRLFNDNLPSKNQHLLTTDYSEYTNLIGQGWNDEGIVGYVYSSSVANSQPVYRWRKNDFTNYLFTTSGDETPADYTSESIAFYAPTGVTVGELGGIAMYVNNTFSSSPVTITIDSGSAQIYGGGGAGGNGGTGGSGGIGGGAGTYTQNLLPRSPIPSGGSGGSGGTGGVGGNGRGYNNSNITGSPGGGGSGGSGGSAYGSPFQFRYPQYSGLGNGVLNWYSGNGGTGGPGGNGGNGGDWGTGGDPGTDGSPGTDGTPSTGGIFLAVRNYTPNVRFRGESNAGHTNCIYIRNMIEFCLGGEGTASQGDYLGEAEVGFDPEYGPIYGPIYDYWQSLGARDAGLYGPVEMYDTNFDPDNPDGIYLSGQVAFLADDNGASGDDANDLIIYIDPEDDNIYGTYTPLYGTGGTGGIGGAGGAAGGAAITGSNYSLSGIVNTNTIKG